MPNIASLLKSEISRLARREIRKEVGPLRKAAAGYRRDIASLKRTVSSLERRTKQLAKSRPSTGPHIDAEASTRFVAKGLVSLRKRLGVSANDFAKLLGVSMQSIYNWEQKKTTPRKEQIAAIVALRSIGRKEARARLDETKSSNGASSRPPARPRRAGKRPSRKPSRAVRSTKRARG